MFVRSTSTPTRHRPRRSHRDGCVLAGESPVAYLARPGRRAGRPSAGLADALAGLEDALDALAAVDLDCEDDRDALDAVVRQERAASRLAGVQLRLLGHVERRDAFTLDGAVTLASWYRARTRLDPGEAARRVHAAVRLRSLPKLAAALATGEVTPAHVTAVAGAAVPTRMEAIAAHEDTLVALALAAGPREMRIALRRISDHVDPDGTDTPPLPGDGPDPRRHLDVWPTVDGLGEILGTLDQLDTEALLTALDALDAPDPADTPAEQRRSPGQRRADALGRLARLALDAGLTPTVQGNRPHLLLTADIDELVADLLDAHRQDSPGDGDRDDGHDSTGGGGEADPAPDADPLDLADLTDRADRADVSDCAEPLDLADLADLRDLHPSSGGAAARGPRAPRLRWTGPLHPDRARCLALQAKATVVLTMGPWRVVNVGRTFRTLPPWLRSILEMVHRHCRGPDCDRPAVWTEAHHQDAWVDQGETNLNRTVPLCKRHHDLVTTGRWRVAFDPDTGECTWTGPHGAVRTTRAPPL